MVHLQASSSSATSATASDPANHSQPISALPRAVDDFLTVCLNEIYGFDSHLLVAVGLTLWLFSWKCLRAQFQHANLCFSFADA
jgi:hypothetical protein